ncbi:MAG: indolepyruvate ferredoxin oxidoreductase subunit alpha [Nitrospirota bacterium]
MNNRILMMGNEAIARGLVEEGCSLATSYPGTPASEILPGIAKWKSELSLPLHVQWAVNEKIAFEIAYAGSIAGLRTAVSMKQVGLNVASDPLMSAAYMGVKGGFIIISADDPGPHSSQTEQDSRLMAMFAKVPVLDPSTPREAKECIALAYELSEAFEIPVLLRPTTRVCHASQDIALGEIHTINRERGFQKEPARWAATPKFRYLLHRALNDKLAAIAGWQKTAPRLLNPDVTSTKAIVTSGVAAAHTRDIMGDLELWEKVAVYQVIQPYPLHTGFISMLLKTYNEILVLEETTGVIEMQLARRDKIRGKMASAVPEAGELLPEVIEQLIADFAQVTRRPLPAPPAVPGRRPSLCPGCPHRASFFAIKKAIPHSTSIYASDIGCYTLGLNLGAIDTFLCMGASISEAAGFYHAYRLMNKETNIVATIGDSTFFHAGIPALVDAVVQDARFVLVILDNSTTAMTGNQPTPATGVGACGDATSKVAIEDIVKSCGVTFCETGNPYLLPEFTALLKKANKHSTTEGLAVVIARYPCLVDKRSKGSRLPGAPITISEECDGCRYCVKEFECPALEFDEQTKKTHVNTLLCTGCGICIHVCPKKAIGKG